MLSMSTLGLSGDPQQEEGLWKRLFWPTIRNAQDADLLGVQGFYICLVIAALTGLLLVAMGQPLVALLAASFYVLGAMGLREGSTPTAALVFVVYLLDKVASLRMGAGGGGFIGLVVLAILLANLRGAVLAARWKKEQTVGLEELEPMRFDATLWDKIRDQLPRKFWPKLRYLFYGVAALMIVLEALAVVAAFGGIGVFKPLPY